MEDLNKFIRALTWLAQEYAQKLYRENGGVVEALGMPEAAVAPVKAERKKREKQPETALPLAETLGATVVVPVVKDLSLEDALSAARAYVIKNQKDNGLDKLRTVLMDKFKVEVVRELKPEQRCAFVAEVAV